MSTHKETALTLKLEPLTEEQLYQLAQFLKRITFNACLEFTDGGDSKEQAYAMIDGLEAVRRALAEKGYAPR